MFNQPINTRRFALIESGEVLAIVDQCRSYTVYGTVSADASGATFLTNLRTYWDDEVEEL